MENYKIKFNTRAECTDLIDFFRAKILTEDSPIRVINMDSKNSHGIFLFYRNPKKHEEYLILIRPDAGADDVVTRIISSVLKTPFICAKNVLEFQGMVRPLIIENIIK